ncbi:PTS sugar transporter subunit IIA [Lacticaseibacillus zhaodongensis]|uniref:PTS sugar transporter subunit IIA n=1 Tax=Lacticaseibacillus zhaodongensis TaxID=2668065 RepID=UPI0012D2ACF9|nr:PTS sugar transporter subunit IIA [Lacticaseibacillus zhaodongensis]
MFGLLKKKNVATNVDLSSTDTIEVLKTLASRTANKLNLDAQELKSGLFGSTAAGTNQIVAGRVLITHTTSSEIKEATGMIITFSKFIPWNDDASNRVDYAVVLVMPTADDNADALTQKAAATVSAHLNQLDEWRDSSSDLNKLLHEII